jgi:hypothetical protein
MLFYTTSVTKLKSYNANQGTSRLLFFFFAMIEIDALVMMMEGSLICEASPSRGGSFGWPGSEKRTTHVHTKVVVPSTMKGDSWMTLLITLTAVTTLGVWVPG